MADTIRTRDYFNNATTGAFKDNTSKAITPQMQRDFCLSTDWIRKAIVVKPTTYTLTDDDDVVLGDNALTGFTLTLPTAIGRTGKVFYIKNINFAAVTIDGNGSETIDGETTLVLSQKNQSVIISSDGANWVIIGGASA